MNNEDLKKLLKSVEICNATTISYCDGCPVRSKTYGECSKKKHELAKKLLQEIEQKEKMSTSEPKAIRFNFDDQMTSAVVHEWLSNGRDMLVGYKPTKDYKQWLVGSIETIDLMTADMEILGISTGVVIRFPLNRDIRLIKWHGGPTADLICIDESCGYKLGERYHMCNGIMSPCADTRSIPAKDGRFASLEDEFIKKHFVPYKGDVLDDKQEKYLNGWLVCVHSDTCLAATSGYRYRITGGCFVDDRGIHHNHFTNSANDMIALDKVWHMIYVPDEN